MTVYEQVSRAADEQYCVCLAQVSRVVLSQEDWARKQQEDWRDRAIFGGRFEWTPSRYLKKGQVALLDRSGGVVGLVFLTGEGA
jgi:hypothetical protein